MTLPSFEKAVSCPLLERCQIRSDLGAGVGCKRRRLANKIAPQHRVERANKPSSERRELMLATSSFYRVTGLALAATTTNNAATIAKVTCRLESLAMKPMKAGPARIPA